MSHDETSMSREVSLRKLCLALRLVRKRATNHPDINYGSSAPATKRQFLGANKREKMVMELVMSTMTPGVWATSLESHTLGNYPTETHGLEWWEQTALAIIVVIYVPTHTV